MEHTLTATATPQAPLVYTRQEAAELAQVSLPTLDKWIRNNDLPVIRIGRQYRIPAERFKDWLNEQVGKFL